jgi:hypothetical protein
MDAHRAAAQLVAGHARRLSLCSCRWRERRSRSAWCRPCAATNGAIANTRANFSSRWPCCWGWQRPCWRCRTCPSRARSCPTCRCGTARSASCWAMAGAAGPRSEPRAVRPRAGRVRVAACSPARSGVVPAPAGATGATTTTCASKYFRARYHPDQVMRVWASLGREDVPIATSFEGYHALRALRHASAHPRISPLPAGRGSRATDRRPRRGRTRAHRRAPGPAAVAIPAGRGHRLLQGVPPSR